MLAETRPSYGVAKLTSALARLPWALILAPVVGAQVHYDTLDYRAHTSDGKISCFAVAEDMSVVFVGRTTEIEVLTRDSVTEAPQIGWTMQDPPVEVPNGGFPMTDMAYDASTGEVFIAAGTYGVYRMEKTGAQTWGNVACAIPDLCYDWTKEPYPTAYEPGVRKWCFDVDFATVGENEYLLALFGAKDGSELRIYDRSALTEELAVVDLFDPTFTTPSEEWVISYSLLVDGDFAYVAMGNGGILRVDLADPNWTVSQGLHPIALRDAGVPHGDADHLKFRDLSITGQYLYAAADSFGLLEVDLAEAWDSTTHSNQALQNYSMRVDSLESDGQIVIALGSASAPVQANEGAPAEASGSWGLRESFGDVDHESFEKSETRVHLFQRAVAQGAELVRCAGARTFLPSVRSYNGIALRSCVLNGEACFFLYDALVAVYGFRRDGGHGVARPASTESNTWTLSPIPSGEGEENDAHLNVDEGIEDADDAASQINSESTDTGAPYDPAVSEMGLTQVFAPNAVSKFQLEIRSRRTGGGFALPGGGGRIEVWAGQTLLGTEDLPDVPLWSTTTFDIDSWFTGLLDPKDLRVELVGPHPLAVSGNYRQRVSAIDLHVPWIFGPLEGQSITVDTADDLRIFTNIMDGVVALGDPNLPVWGIDGGGQLFDMVRVEDDNGTISFVGIPGTDGSGCPEPGVNQYVMGHFPEGQWLDPDGFHEFLLGGGKDPTGMQNRYVWRAARFLADPFADWTRIFLLPEEDPWWSDQSSYNSPFGASYSHANVAEEAEWIQGGVSKEGVGLMMRARVPHGLVVMSLDDIELVMSQCSPPADPCEDTCAPVSISQFPLVTHPELEDHQVPVGSAERDLWKNCKIWGATAFDLDGEEQFVASACGYVVTDATSSPANETLLEDRGLVTFHRLVGDHCADFAKPIHWETTKDADMPTEDSYGPLGNFIGIDSFEFGDTTWVFLADFTGRIVAYDTSGLAAVVDEHCDLANPPTLELPRHEFHLPLNVIDGRRDNPFDIEVVSEGNDVAVYAAAYRLGLLRIELDVVNGAFAGFDEDSVVYVDTPGLATGIKVIIGSTGSAQAMILGDNLFGGLRALGNW